MTINKVCVGGRWGKGTKVARTGNGAVFPTSRVRGGGGSVRWGREENVWLQNAAKTSVIQFQSNHALVSLLVVIKERF